MAASRLQTELDYFEERRDELCREHLGKVAVVKGREVHGFFDSEMEAYEAGVERFGIEPFMIKKVETLEQELRWARAAGFGPNWMRRAS